MEIAMTRTHFDTKETHTVTRADLAEAVYGRVGLSRADSAEMVEVVLGEISEAIAKVDSGDGAVVLTDLFGGTPSNLAISLMKAGQIEVIAGINLPMLIRLAKARGCMPLDKAVIAGRDAGRNYITIASEFLGQDA